MRDQPKKFNRCSNLAGHKGQCMLPFYDSPFFFKELLLNFFLLFVLSLLYNWYYFTTAATFNKLTSVFHASVDSRVAPDYFDNVMTKFMINNRSDA